MLKNDIAVILIDVNMPEMDGFELAAMIRQHPRFEQTALVLISAVQMTDLDQLRIGVPGARPAGPSGFTGCRTRAQGGLGRLKAQGVVEPRFFNSVDEEASRHNNRRVAVTQIAFRWTF